MNASQIIEIVGYLGSFLVLVSFLMTSVVKLRIVNTIGSVIFMIYALIIKSYPTAIMNFCLVLINLRFLYKLNKIEKEYELIETEDEDKYLSYLLNYYKDDINAVFPNINIDLVNSNRNYLISNNGKVVGFTISNETKDEAEFLLDYSIPEYRDSSVGRFLSMKLKEKGIKKIKYKGPTENHIKYLTDNGFLFTKNENRYGFFETI